MMRLWNLGVCVLGASVLAGGCGREPASGTQGSAAGGRPSILLITLDTTRADAIGPGASGVRTPAFDALAARGVRFTQAYTTVPETLPAHVSMMTGLYPGGHGVHENARSVAAETPVLAERLKASGYRTAAVISSFALARRFGLARGFDVYDDQQPAGKSERIATEAVDAAVRVLEHPGSGPLFLWVHFYDPHYPYAPPAPYREQYRDQPYLGEVAFMDAQIGRLVDAFDRATAAPRAFVVAGDHGEGLGDHGEALHGNLLYQSTVHVPLAVVGPGLASSVNDTPVSTRHVYDTVLEFAGVARGRGLQRPAAEPVLGEAMKPFLEYGWQPQVMVVDGARKAILAGTVEAYDLTSDPRETNNLGGGANMTAAARQALDGYPVPSPDAARPPAAMDDEARQRLASLGYVGAEAAPIVRKDAPRPADMTPLFEVIDRASGLFVAGEYAAAIPLLQRIVKADPYNLDARLRLGAAYSALDRNADAVKAFTDAAAIAPRSTDVKLYLALHYARGPEWARAEPMLEEIVKTTPDRLPAVEGLAAIREREGRLAEAVTLRQQAYALRDPSAAELLRLGTLAMEAQQTPAAIDAFEKARAAQGASFTHDLELGVLYLAARRLPEARAALDRVPSSSAGYPMALFKRAQVAVLLNEPDRADRIAAARRGADDTTRALIAREALFSR